jgi:hypothetical protein
MPLLQAFPFPSTLGEVTVHQLSQACVFIYSSRGKWVFYPLCGVFLPLPLLQAFPLLIAAGCVLLFLPCPAGLFIYRSRGKWVFPPVLWSFSPTATFTSFPTPGCWACATSPAFSSWLAVRDFPSPLFSAQGTLPSLLCVFLLLLLIIQFFSFFPGWGRSFQRLCWSCPGLSVGVLSAA